VDSLHITFLHSPLYISYIFLHLNTHSTDNDTKLQAVQMLAASSVTLKEEHQLNKFDGRQPDGS
jgi:hypothetical protein